MDHCWNLPFSTMTGSGLGVTPESTTTIKEDFLKLPHHLTTLDELHDETGWCYLCVSGRASRGRPHSADHSSAVRSKTELLHSVRCHCGCLVPHSPSSQSRTSLQFLEIHIIRPRLRMTVSKAFCDNNKVLHTADPSLQTKPWLVPRLKPIQAGSDEWNLYEIRKSQWLPL